jgi:2-oxoacid:acceptor oxidoreductase delta subunit (pyruvate/2-ketoisovalerate family)
MPRLDCDPKSLPQVLNGDRSMSENLTGNWRSIRPVIDEARCTGCLICWKFCPEACVHIVAGKKEPVIDMQYCKGCGICAEECPPKCIAIQEESAVQGAAQ